MSNPAVHSSTASASINGAIAISPVMPIQAPIGDKASDSPRTRCDKLVNLLVYEYPKIIRRANGDMSKHRRFNIPAKTTNKIAQKIVKNQRFVFPIRLWS